MARVTSTHRAVSSRRVTARVPDGLLPALAFVTVIALVGLAAYLAHNAIQDFVLPVGPDGPVYTWRTELAGAEGLGAAPAGRPGIHAIILIVGSVLGLEPVQSVMILGPVLAVTCGLAAASLLEAALGAGLARAAAAALLTTAFAAYLAGGWLANLALATMFLGALAALAVGRTSWRAVFAAGALIAASLLTHRLFSLVVLAVGAGVVLALVPSALAARGRGERLRDTDAFRVSAGLVGGVAIGLIGLASTMGAATVPGDPSQDALLRRLGAQELLRGRHRERFAGDATRAAVPLVTAVGLGIYGWMGAERSRGLTYVGGIVGSWLAVTAGGIAVLAVTGWGPPNRLLVFAFFIPLAAALGVAAAWERGTTARVVALVAALAFAGSAMFGWYRQSPNLSPDELALVERAGEAIEDTPAGLPLIFLVDTDQQAAGYHVARAGNVIRMGMPPERIPHTRLVVGLPEDLLAGRPSLTGDPERDLVSTEYFREARGDLEDAVVMVLEPFNPIGFQEARSLGREIAPGIVVLDSPVVPTPPETAPATTSPGMAALLSAAALAALWAAGLGWARWATPGVGWRGVACLAAAAGLGILVIAGVGTDIFGADADGPVPLVVAVLLSGAGYVAARRHPDRRGHPVH